MTCTWYACRLPIGQRYAGLCDHHAREYVTAGLSCDTSKIVRAWALALGGREKAIEQLDKLLKT